MRIIVPGVRERRRILKVFDQYYDGAVEEEDLTDAIGDLVSFFGLEKPKLKWRNKIDQGRTLGVTFQDGSIHMIRPSKWEYDKERWINTLLHEIGHYVLWADCETKADKFAFLVGKTN